MEFIKMHGIGNDYVYVDCFKNPAPIDPAALSIEISKPHTGVGSDGLILILPEEGADARMRIFNTDGSEGNMCGNGIRCVGKYLYDSGLVKKEKMRIMTGGGLRELEMVIEGGVATGARVEMGVPVIEPKKKTLVFPDGGRADFTYLSLGNFHAVTLDRPQKSDAQFFSDGPFAETNPVFPTHVNASFLEVLDSSHLKTRIWERGSGPTMACGSGACATLVAASHAGACNRSATVSLPGGDLFIEWTPSGSVFMTGPAEISFTGIWKNKL